MLTAYPQDVHADDTRLEKDLPSRGVNGNAMNGNTTGTDNESGDTLARMRTAGSVNISSELFEKLYLSPETRVKGDLRNTFGNPTPMYGLVLMCRRCTSLTSLQCSGRFPS